MAAVRTTRAAIPGYRARRRQRRHDPSVNAYMPDPVVVDYAAAKAAVWNLSKALSKEFGAQGIRFNTISPGPVATPLWLGEHGVAATVAKSMGVDVDDRRATSSQARAGSPPDASPNPRRSPTWSCCWPATAPATSPARTSSSTAA